MAEYTLEVTTGSMPHIGRFDNLHVTLIGTERQSERTHLSNFDLGEQTGNVGTFSVTTLLSLGCLLFLKVEKDPFHESPQRDWYCSKIVVRTPEKDEILFPCHRWLSSGESVLLRGGRATKAFEDLHPRLMEQRKKELVEQQLKYKWTEFADGLLYVLNINDPKSVPSEISFSFSKAFQFNFFREAGAVELRMRGLTDSTQRWESIEDMKNFTWFKTAPFFEYVSQHWKDDDFFGYQFLNGADPSMIQRCSKLPDNFAVTEEMVKPFLANGSSLSAEMEKGNIFIIDYKVMEGLHTRVIDEENVPLTAPLCLFYLNPEKKLLPIAIQLHQQPSEDNPIFLPSDSESDWLLAKIFVRHADCLNNQIVSHFHNIHLLTEVFAVATLRNLPMIHPLHKLLIPHHRHTIHVNVLARHLLFGPGRVLQNSSLGGVGVMQLMKKSFSEMTYKSLRLPEDISARGLESIPNFYYRDDAVRLWSIINRFVTAVVGYFYPCDGEVSADTELQDWISEIFYHGFLGNISSGIPSSFNSVEQVIQFVTTVIFTSSVQHATVTDSEFDFQGWIPNGPFLLHKAPPTAKGQSSMEDILETLPNKAYSGLSLSVIWLNSRKYDDFVPLGEYPDQRFEEPAVLQMIKDFQADLLLLRVAITRRNSELPLPYYYLNPTNIENSVTV